MGRRCAFDAQHIQINNLLTIYGAGEDAPFSGDGFVFFFFLTRFCSRSAAIFRCFSVAPRRGSTSASQFALSFRCLLRAMASSLLALSLFWGVRSTRRSGDPWCAKEPRRVFSPAVLLRFRSLAHRAALVAVPPDPPRGEEAAHPSRLCPATTLCDADAGTGGAEAGPPMHYCSLYDVRRQPRRHQGRIMRSRVNVQIGISVRSSRACRKRLVSRPLRRLLPLALCTRPTPGAVEPGSDREPYGKARVEIHAYLGLRRLLADF